MPVTRISEFDTWRPGYALASVHVLRANTNLLADIFSDEALTIAAANPQTLLQKSQDGVDYGKFAQPLYTAQAFELQINTVDSTGIERVPLTSLEGEDASLALIEPEDASVAHTAAHHAGRRYDVRDFGSFLILGAVGSSAAANTSALVNCIGRATADGGGIVEIPAGVFLHTPFNVPVGVTVRGRGRAATTLQCTQGSRIVTLGGDRAGLEDITLDGVSKAATSIGVYALGRNQLALTNVAIKRFETGLYVRGGSACRFDDLYVSDCSYGAKLHGDDDASLTGTGAPMLFTGWTGGRVEFCSIAGLELKRVDLPCLQTVLARVGFEGNTGSALRIEGARQVKLTGCWFTTNTVNINVADGSPLDLTNSVIDVVLEDGRVVDGEIRLRGTLESFAFRRMDLEQVDIILTAPSHNITAEDCRETECTITGVATAWVRSSTHHRGASAGLTTGNAATKAWAITLEPGQRVYLEAKVIGRGRNVTEDGFYHFAVSAWRPVCELAYDTQTGNFTAGNLLTGATSGAIGRIVADLDGGATGTLGLQDISGAFVDNELISDGSVGSATVNGTLVDFDAALLGSVTALRTAQETTAGWDATFVANGPEIELRVTGDSGQTVEWICDVEVISNG